jgi:hypothetical protein
MNQTTEKHEFVSIFHVELIENRSTDPMTQALIHSIADNPQQCIFASAHGGKFVGAPSQSILSEISIQS